MTKINTVPRLESYKGVVNFVKNPMPVIDTAINKYGQTYYTRIVGGRKLVMTIDPNVAQHVLQKNNKNYIKSELQTESLGRYIGYGLLTSNGEYWLRQRRLIQPGFYKEKLQGLVTIMHDEIKAYCEDLSKKLTKGRNVVDINEAMVELTLRVVSRSLFSTGISQELIRDLGESFIELQKHIVVEVRQPIFNWWRVLSGKRRKTYRLAEATKDIMRKIISERRASGGRTDDLLDMLLHAQYEDNGAYMTDQQLLDETIILFVAGHETTANTLAWTLFAVLQNDEIYNKARAEAKTYSGQKLDFFKLKEGSYIDDIIEESLRQYPPAWILDRIALEDDKIGDVAINRGDLVGIYVYGLHHHKEYWAEAQVYNPDRVLNEDSNLKHPYRFIPFGGGPRLCIGNHFAMLEMKLALIELFNRFEMALVPDQQIVFEPLITLRPSRPILLELINSSAETN